MMTPKEKALEIYERNSEILSKHIFNGHHDIAIEISINEATEILNALTFNMYDEEEYNKVNDFWEQVKVELERL